MRLYKHPVLVPPAFSGSRPQQRGTLPRLAQLVSARLMQRPKPKPVFLSNLGASIIFILPLTSFEESRRYCKPAGNLYARVRRAVLAEDGNRRAVVRVFGLADSWCHQRFF